MGLPRRAEILRSASDASRFHELGGRIDRIVRDRESANATKGPFPSPRLPLALSLAAVAISILAWRESHTARINSEKKDRAELDVISARILPSLSKDGVRTVELGLVNRGHATATEVGYWKGLEIVYARNPTDFQPAPKYFERPPHAPVTTFRKVLSG